MPHRHSLGRTLDLNLCFTKIKFPLHYFSQSSAAATTPPHDHSRPSPSAAAASSNADNLMMIRNFNSLYDSSSSSSPSDHNTDSGAAAAAAGAACRSLSSGRRFFVSAPGRSNSIADSASASASAAGRRDGGAAVELVGNSLAVPTLSPDPYADFRRSMQEMVEARERRLHRNDDDDDDNDVKDNCSKNRSSNWEFLHELLLCYLALNPKSTHKFIIGAFSDLVVSMLPPLPPEINGGHKEVDLVAAAVAASDK